MNNCLPRDSTTDAEGGKTEPATGTQTVRRLIVLMLFTAAALDLTRCGLVLATAQHPAPAAGLITAGLAAAAVSIWTARGCRGGRCWATWGAVLIGAASAPQAAANGFHSPYAIPDTATAALQHLSPAHQSVLVETFYRGGTMATVARELGIPHGTARSRLHYALDAIRKQLEEHDAIAAS